MDRLPETLKPILEQIAAQSLTSQQYRSNIENLLKIYKNIHQAGSNSEKFTRISVEKAHEKLWMKAPAMKDFMLHSGWSMENDHIRFSDHTNLRATINLLADERTHVSPSDKEWVAETKVENIRLNGEDPREERLRQEAAKRREEALGACLEEKEQRRLLNETIKLNIRADKEHRRKMQEGAASLE